MFRGAPRVPDGFSDIENSLKQIDDSWYIYQNKLDMACIQHGMPFRDFTDLTRRTTSNKILHDKAFNIVQNFGLLLRNITQRAFPELLLEIYPSGLV